MKELDLVVLVEVKMHVVMIWYAIRINLGDVLTKKVRTALRQIHFQKNVALSIRMPLLNVVLVFHAKVQIVCNTAQHPNCLKILPVYISNCVTSDHDPSFK